MPLEDDFGAAQAQVKTLSRTPAPDELLDLYALYKQATVGEVSGDRPGMLDFKGRAKFDAWSGKRGVDKNAAMTSYVELVRKLKEKYG